MRDAAVALMRRIQVGDSGALGELMAVHGQALRVHLARYVPAADAEDLLQELWLRVWRRAGQWDGRGRPLAWLLAIATNLALNHLRDRRAAIPTVPLDAEETMETRASASEVAVPGPEDQVLWRDQLDRLNALMALLPEEKQAALLLVRVEGYTLREAADLLGVPVGTLKSRLHHAHRMLMEHLEEEHERD